MSGYRISSLLALSRAVHPFGWDSLSALSQGLCTCHGAGFLLQKAPIQNCLCWVFLLHLLAHIIFPMSFLSWLGPVWFNEGCCCQQGSGYVWWNRHLNLPLQMGSAQHPDMTLVKVLWRVTFPLYLSPLLCSSFASREVSELLEICPLFSSPLQRHCQPNTQTT